MVLTLAFAVFTAVMLLVQGIRRHPRGSLLVLALVAVVFSLFAIHVLPPDSPSDVEGLRRDYVNSTRSFDGALYVWGGESHFGIDCSGLVRMALVEAMLRRGLVSGDARLLADAGKFWWRDVSARAMHESIYGYTEAIGHAKELSSPDTLRMNPGSALREGDTAVTESKVHVMVYAGDGRWTEESPEDLRVVTNTAAGSNRCYFNMPVTILRWWVFTDRSSITIAPAPCLLLRTPSLGRWYICYPSKTSFATAMADMARGQPA